MQKAYAVVTLICAAMLAARPMLAAGIPVDIHTRTAVRPLPAFTVTRTAEFSAVIRPARNSSIHTPALPPANCPVVVLATLSTT